MDVAFAQARAADPEEAAAAAHVGDGRTARIAHGRPQATDEDDQLGAMGRGYRAIYEEALELLPTTIGHLEEATLVAGAWSAGMLCAAWPEADGTVQCWGNTNDLGYRIGQVGGFQAQPVPEAKGATSIAIGRHSCFVGGDGTVQCWGTNFIGQAGTDGAVGYREPAGPVTLASGDPLRAERVRVGLASSVALTDDGAVYVWGARSGQPEEQWHARRLDLPPVRDAAPTTKSLCIVLDDDEGGVACFERWAEPGEQGLTPLPGPRDLVAVRARDDLACVLERAGGVWCWPDAGDGSPRVPRRIEGLPPASRIAVGPLNACAVTRERDGVWCWGNNQLGQLGDGTLIDRETPAPVRHLFEEVPRLSALDAPVPERGLPAQTLPESLPPAACSRTRTVTIDVQEQPLRTLEIQAAHIHRVDDPLIRQGIQARHEDVWLIVLTNFPFAADVLAPSIRGGESFLQIVIDGVERPVVGTYGPEHGHPLGAWLVERGGLVGGTSEYGGTVEVDYIDESWICGTLALSYGRHARVDGDFVARIAPLPPLTKP